MPSTEVPSEDPPLEGLAMLQNIRAELQKVGQMIVKNKDGEKFLQRAQILASINYLASNVPRCVLEDLGQEIKDQLKAQEEKKNRKMKAEENVMNSLLRISVDDASVASDISQHEEHNTFAGDKSFADSIETASDGEEEDDFFPETPTPETVRRKYTLENFVPMKTPMGIRENRLSLNSTTHHSTGIVLAPKLRKDSGPERRGADRTYSFSSMSSSSESTDDWDEPALPILTYFECALLFVDISGFTKLSTLLDPENLSKVINTYFELLVSHVSDFNGDIQKFAGDALFAEFRATPSCPLSKCCELAAACAASLVRDCSDFPVSTICGLMDTDIEGIPASLNVHCGLGIGEMAGIHIGDNENRREYLYLGNPIKQTAEACDFAQLGEAAASPEFCRHLQEMNVFQPNLLAKEQPAFVIAERSNSFLNCNEAELLTSQRMNARSRGITENVEGLEPASLKEYRRLMSLYVHPVAVLNDVAAENDFSPTSRKKEKNSRDRQLEEAELRSVYTMFVNPKVSVEMTGDVAKDTASVEIVHEIMKIANRELRKYNGHMRQFVMDDKGMVFIATFGLRGSTFPNMVGERALPATIAMYNALHYELGIEVNIGATFGDAYCGAVGGEKRHEYAVMGPSVNLAARLMANKSNPGILVDKAVRKLASQSFAFNALPAIKAKGYKELVPIFEPLSPVDRGWGEIIPHFVGRQEPMQKITKIASEFYRRQKCNTQMVIIRASTGMGKSTLLAHSIDKVKKLFVSRRVRVGIAKHVGRESESMRPFLAAANLLRIMLSHYKGSFDDTKSVASGKDSCYSSMAGSVGGESVSYSGDSTVLSMSEFADRLEAVFIETGAPIEHFEYIQALLSEDYVKQDKLLAELDGDMVSTLASAFGRINNSLRLSILAIDDAHHCDEASWLVFEEIFMFSENTLFLTTTSGTSLADLKISKAFLAELQNRYVKANRCHFVSLENLSRDEVRHMIMKTLALQEHEVTDLILDSVFSQSLGMPLVANGLVEKLKQTERNVSQLIDFGGSGSVADIFLHKIDGFDTTVRDALNVCALLGNNCCFDDIYAVLSGMSDGKDEDIRTECKSSVELLLKEGILTENSGEYIFSYDLWRTIPLGLMLASRKRDIHRKVAQHMEGKISHLDAEKVPFEMHAKIFEHWKATGDTTKSTASSLVLRRLLEKEGDFARCVSIFEDVLSLWGWKSESNETRLAGLSKAFLHHVAAEELSNIITMLVGLGKAYAESSRPNIGVIWWENALRVMHSTKSAPLIRDISIVFPAFDGISKAIQDGHMVQDVYCRYEQAMIRKFIQETRAHGRLIHHIHALFLQMKLYGRQGDLDKGIAVYSIIKSIYKPEKHSEKLRLAYGQDSGALSQALCAFWETMEGEKKNGLKMCRSVLKDLLPRLDRDFLNMFNLMYPLSMAFKEAGYPSEAKGFFSKLVIAPFEDCPEDHTLRHLVQVFPAISILFGVANSKKVTRAEVREWAVWVVQQRPFGRKLQLELGRFGRCANSLLAEICLLLADKVQKTDPLRAQVLGKGNELIAEALHFHRKFGMVCAIKPTKSLMNRLRRASKSS